MQGEKSDAAVDAADIAKVRKRTLLPWKECKRFLASLTVAERQKYFAAIEGQRSVMLHDPIEDDPSVRPLFLAAVDEATRETEQLFGLRRGSCHRIWHRTKEILKERNGIDWRSPADMNPGTLFD